jgi:hypothetical protein
MTDRPRYGDVPLYGCQLRFLVYNGSDVSVHEGLTRGFGVIEHHGTRHPMYE